LALPDWELAAEPVGLAPVGVTKRTLPVGSDRKAQQPEDGTEAGPAAPRPNARS